MTTTEKTPKTKWLAVVVFAILAYILHKLVLTFLTPNACNIPYFAEIIYGFFFISSVIIIFLLTKVRSITIDYVGYTFLLLTCVKMAAAYAFYNILLKPEGGAGSCKINFFMAFILFLAVETYTAVKLLGKAE